MNKIKIIFFGTPEFAWIILDKLLKQDNFEIVAVVTALDKPTGRKQILTPPPAKVLAEKNNIPVLQPAELNNEFIENLKKYQADLMVTAAYGKIIPKEILDLFHERSLNVHPSLLPKYRGASPIQTALLNGDDKTGVTIMLMDEKMDHGSIVSSVKVSSIKDKKFTELHDKLAKFGAELLIKTIPDYLSGKIIPVEQEHEKATFCKIIKKQDGEINWNNTAEQIYNQWRAFHKWPGIFSILNIKNKKSKIEFTEINPVGTGHCPVQHPKRTEEFFVKDKKLFITCSKNTVLEIKKLKPQGKKEMDAASFINGYLTN